MSISDHGRSVDFGHVGIHVSDIERSIRFYRDIVGLEVKARRLREEPYLSDLTGYRGLRLDTCLLVEPASGTQFELLKLLTEDGEPAEPGTANAGTVHLCFIVDDVDTVYERAMAAGVQAIHEPITPTAGRWIGGRNVYLLDPDRIRVEIVQPGPAS